METSDDKLHIFFDPQTEIAGFDLRRLTELVRHICGRFSVGQAVIDIQIVDDPGISEVHRRFLDDPATTDVISFDLSDEDEKSFQLVVNAEMAQRKAAELGHSAEAELALYITHGMLHNLGFDDIEEPQAKKMHETEDALLQELGFGVIYYKQDNLD